jgi:hypothetical protein
VLALPLLIKILLEKDDDKKKDKEKEKEKDRKSTDSNHSDGRARDKEHTNPSSTVTISTSSSNSSNSSSGRGASSITCNTIVQIFDAEMILLIMQDVIGMTCHGINTSSSSSSSSSASSATQGGGLERTISQERESRDAPEGAERDADRDRDREGKEGSSRIEAEERGGDDLERGRKRDALGSDKDSSLGQSDAASNLKIELLKVDDVA